MNLFYRTLILSPPAFQGQTAYAQHKSAHGGNQIYTIHILVCLNYVFSGWIYPS